MHRWTVRPGNRVLVLAALLVLLAGGCDWIQFAGGGHSGVSPDTTITTANAHNLRRLWRVALPARADGSPVVVLGVSTPGGKRDLVVVTTVAGDVVAVDATTHAIVWQRSHPAANCKINNGSSPCYTTSSPALDPDRAHVYTYGLDGKVHKHQLSDGAEVLGGGWPVTVSLKPFDEKGSSALSTFTDASGHSYLYATLGGYPGDRGDYQGHVVTVDLATGTARVFNTLCSDQTVLFQEAPGTPDCPQKISGVWARAGVVYSPDTDRIYLSTGNGAFAPAQHDWGDTVLALRPDGTGASGNPLDTYTPTNFQQLDDFDIDLGSAAPAVLPATPSATVHHLAVQGGKDAKLRLLNLDNLSGQGGIGHLGGEVGAPIAVPQGGEVLSHPTVWTNPADGSPWVFVTTSSGVSGLQLVISGNGTPSLVTRWMTAGQKTSGTAVIEGGVLFVPSNGVIVGYDATTGRPLWYSDIAGVHWESPALGADKVFVPDENAQLTAYGF